MALDLLAVTHVNVNCSNLERSMRFYRDLVGLVPQSHTRPHPQEGSGFGLPGQVVWDAYLLHDDRAQAGPAIDLLEWKQPKPVGEPHPEANHLGFMRVCLAAENLDALHATLVAAGVPTRSAPVQVPVLADQTVKFFCCADRAEPPPASGAGFGFPGDCDYRADFLAVAGNPGSLILDLLEWKTPKPVGRPLVPANHLGVFRMAFQVADAAASCAELDELGIEHSGPCWLEMGPDLPMIDGLNAVFFRDPDGTMLELIETPKIKPLEA